MSKKTHWLSKDNETCWLWGQKFLLSLEEIMTWLLDIIQRYDHDIENLQIIIKKLKEKIDTLYKHVQL